MIGDGCVSGAMDMISHKETGRFHWREELHSIFFFFLA